MITRLVCIGVVIILAIKPSLAAQQMLTEPFNIPSPYDGVIGVTGLSMTFNMKEPRDMCVIETQGECVVEYIAEGNTIRFPKGFQFSINHEQGQPR